MTPDALPVENVHHARVAVQDITGAGRKLAKTAPRARRRFRRKAEPKPREGPASPNRSPERADGQCSAMHSEAAVRQQTGDGTGIFGRAPSATTGATTFPVPARTVIDVMRYEGVRMLRTVSVVPLLTVSVNPPMTRCGG